MFVVVFVVRIKIVINVIEEIGVLIVVFVTNGCMGVNAIVRFLVCYSEFHLL